MIDHRTCSKSENVFPFPKLSQENRQVFKRGHLFSTSRGLACVASVSSERKAIFREIGRAQKKRSRFFCARLFLARPETGK